MTVFILVFLLQEEVCSASILAFLQAARLDARLAKVSLLNARLQAGGIIPGEWFASQMDKERLKLWDGALRSMLDLSFCSPSDAPLSRVVTLGLKGHGLASVIGGRVAMQLSDLMQGNANGDKKLSLTMLEESEVVAKGMASSLYSSCLDRCGSFIHGEPQYFHGYINSGCEEARGSGFPSEDSKAIERCGIVLDILPTRSLGRVIDNVAKAIRNEVGRAEQANKKLDIAFVAPSAVRVKGVLIESQEIFSMFCLLKQENLKEPNQLPSGAHQYLGPNCATEFDLSAFSRTYPQSGRSLRLKDYKYTILSEEFTAMHIPFAPADGIRFDEWIDANMSAYESLIPPTTTSVNISTAGMKAYPDERFEREFEYSREFLGTVQFVAYWLELSLDENTSVSYAPLAGTTACNWQHIAAIPADQMMSVNETATVSFSNLIFCLVCSPIKLDFIV